MIVSVIVFKKKIVLSKNIVISVILPRALSVIWLIISRLSFIILDLSVFEGFNV